MKLIYSLDLNTYLRLPKSEIKDKIIHAEYTDDLGQEGLEIMVFEPVFKPVLRKAA